MFETQDPVYTVSKICIKALCSIIMRLLWFQRHTVTRNPSTPSECSSRSRGGALGTPPPPPSFWVKNRRNHRRKKSRQGKKKEKIRSGSATGMANYGCHYGFENRIMFLQGREVINGRGRFCLYAVSGIINKVNQQNIIRRLKLVPHINATTSLGALCLISVAPFIKSGSAKGQIFHCAC